MMCRNATFFTVYAELLGVYAYVPVMYSPQDVVQDTELQLKVGSLKMNTALEYSTRVVQEGGRRCKKSKFCISWEERNNSAYPEERMPVVKNAAVL
jgi:hypothetical protein